MTGFKTEKVKAPKFSMDEYIEIGTTKKPFGVHGDLKVDVAEAFLEDFLQAKILFISVKGKPVPYFVEEIKVKGAPLVKFEEVDNKEVAGKIGGSKLYLRSQDVIPEEQRQLVVEEALEFGRLVKYKIVEEQLGEIGIIEEVVEFPQQEMAVVRYKKKEVLIPLNDSLIVSLDQEQRILTMKLPEGLLEI